jgi:hypothetical protein
LAPRMREGRKRAAILLFHAKAGLVDRLVLTLDEMSKWQPWIPLGLVALTGQLDATLEAAERLACSNLTELIGVGSSNNFGLGASSNGLERS